MPISLQNNAAVTTAYQVGLTWSLGAYNGGTAVIDFRVSYAAFPSTDFKVFSDSVLSESATVTGLTAGITYTFYV